MAPSVKGFVPDSESDGTLLPEPGAKAPAETAADTKKAETKVAKKAKAKKAAEPKVSKKPVAKKSAAKAAPVKAGASKAAAKKSEANGKVPMTKTIEDFFLKGGTMADALKHVEKVHGSARQGHIAGHLRTLEKKGWKRTVKGDTISIASPR